ncbi:nitroreductase family protein [bacterium]|nr:nitroreductase family protein [bacterium]
MSVLEIIKKRRSIRKFKPDPISEEVIDKLIEAIIWAPSAGNKQMRKFFFVFNKKIKKEIALTSLYQMFIEEAPLVIVACGDKGIERYYGKRGLENYLFCDVAASIQNLLLVAQEEGLGSCWVGAFDEEEIKKILNLSENLIPVAIIPVGYPQKIPSPPPRKDKNSLIEVIK